MFEEGLRVNRTRGPLTYPSEGLHDAGSMLPMDGGVTPTVDASRAVVVDLTSPEGIAEHIRVNLKHIVKAANYHTDSIHG